jgi:outer membrane protein OmpA-like peptidoglycan-associated protein
MGMVIGGVVGGLLGGPPGSIFGIASGAWLGDNEAKEDRKIAGLQNSLVKKQADLSIMEQQFADLQRQFGNEIQRVSAQNRQSALDDLANGVSLAVYFRTGSANLDEASTVRVRHLAGFLQQFPEVRLLVEGYADKRGAAEFNKHLSQTRAGVVESVLLNAGINPDRILTHSYGESGAIAEETDKEGVVFDRRVDIILTLDTRI